MRQIDTTTATATKPTPPAVGTAKWFQDTDTSGGTIVPAWFLNSVQDEIVNVITDAGLTPDKADDTQLSTAVQGISSGTLSTGTNGYQILPSGLIIQWMTATESANDASEVSWPIPFPTAAFCATATPIDSVNAGCLIKSISQTGLIFKCGDAYGNGHTAFVVAYGN